MRWGTVFAFAAATHATNGAIFLPDLGELPINSDVQREQGRDRTLS
jgi:hypothetical protein